MNLTADKKELERQAKEELKKYPGSSADCLRYLGRPLGWWLELKRQALLLGVENLIQEIADLRAKNSFYESRIQEMNSFMNKKIRVEDKCPGE